MIDIPTVVIERPNEKQKMFLLDHHKHVAFGGARGGGKSWAIRTKALLLALKHSGIKIMIIRKTYAELQNNHIKVLKKLCKCGTSDAIARYNDSKKELLFPNGSEILFQYCNTESDVDRVQGLEIDILFLDEATQLTELQIKSLLACVRGVNEFPKRIYYTCNPGGKGHAYIKRLFVDKEYVQGEYPEEYSFIQSKVYDNKALMDADPEYIRQLESLPEALRKAWLEGDWNSFVGQVFQEWRNDADHYQDRRWTHVIDDFDIDDSYRIYRGFDYGYSRPFSVGWYAVDHKGTIYRIRELYGCGREANQGVMWTPQDIAKKIKEIEETDPNLKHKKIIGIADPAIWQSTTGESIAEMMERCGVYFSKGDHTRLAGKMQFHYRLAFDDMGIPMFYCFKSCSNFIRTIPTLIYDEKNVEDIDSDMEDHCLTGDTKVLTDKGWKAIKDMDRNGYVLSHDGKFHRYTDCGYTQTTKVYTLTTDDGHTVTATANHRFMLADGSWKRMDELQEGDELMKCQLKTIVIRPTIQEFNGERFYLCGNYFQHKGKRLQSRHSAQGNVQSIGEWKMRVKMVALSGVEDVYNMEVEDTHSFVIDGGIVSHNCYDECRYVFMDHPINPRHSIPKPTMSFDPLNMMEDITK